MKLKYGVMRNQDFVDAASRLFASPMRTAAQSYALAKVAKALQSEMQTMDVAWKTLISSYVDLKAAESEAVAIPPERADEFSVEFQKFCEIEIELPDAKINPDDIKSDKLSPRDFVILESFIEQP